MTNDRQARAARAEQMRKDREKAERKQRNLISVAIVAVVVLLIGVGGWAIKDAADDNAEQIEVIKPRNTTENGIDYPAGEAENSSAPVVEVFADFLCPSCGLFEQISGSFLSEQATAGNIQLRFMPFSFLHDESTNDYSRRAMNLGICAVDEQGPEAFWKVHDALFANQPAEGGPGPEDAALIKMAEDVGVSGLGNCVRTEKFVPWIDQTKAKFDADEDIPGTPAVHINGKASQARQPQDLAAAIAAA